MTVANNSNADSLKIKTASDRDASLVPLVLQ